jgi:hypothetical protein
MTLPPRSKYLLDGSYRYRSCDLVFLFEISQAERHRNANFRFPCDMYAIMGRILLSSLNVDYRIN